MNRWGYAYEITLRGRILKPWKDSNGYFVVYICGEGRREAINVHRLIAITFHNQNVRNGLIVNHLDGNKQNNTAPNLEWCTSKENIDHAIKTGLNDQRKSLIGTPINGGPTVMYASSKDAAIALGTKGKGNIRSAACGSLRQAYGYFWKHNNVTALQD